VQNLPLEQSESAFVKDVQLLIIRVNWEKCTIFFGQLCEWLLEELKGSKTRRKVINLRPNISREWPFIHSYMPFRLSQSKSSWPLQHQISSPRQYTSTWASFSAAIGYWRNSLEINDCAGAPLSRWFCDKAGLLWQTYANLGTLYSFLNVQEANHSVGRNLVLLFRNCSKSSIQVLFCLLFWIRVRNSSLIHNVSTGRQRNQNPNKLPWLRTHPNRHQKIMSSSQLKPVNGTASLVFIVPPRTHRLKRQYTITKLNPS